MQNPRLNRAIFMLSLVGLMVAGYLWKMHANPADIPCGGGNECETVANSPYSRFPTGSGPPVAMYGTLGYLAILTLSFLRTLGSPARLGPRDTTLLVLLTAAAAFGTAASLYLTTMELTVIHAICRWCIGSQVIIGVVFALAVADLSRTRAASKRIVSAGNGGNE